MFFLTTCTTQIGLLLALCSYPVQPMDSVEKVTSSYATTERDFVGMPTVSDPAAMLRAASRDASAVKAVADAIEAMGGATEWRKVSAVRETGTLKDSSPGAPVTTTFEWKELWKGRRVWISRENKSGEKRTLYKRMPEDATKPGLSKLRRPTRLLRPSPHLPASALLGLLDDVGCAILNAESHREQSRSVRVICSATTGSPSKDEEVWTFSLASSLPVELVTTIENLSGVRPLLETLRFQEFRSFDGLQVPVTFEVLKPNRSTMNVHVEAVSFPTKFAPEDFTEAK